MNRIVSLALVLVAASVVGSASVALGQGSATGPAKIYGIIDRVEVNYDGTWYKGVILAVRDGKYQVKRDDYMSDDRWFASSDIRPLAEAARKIPLPKGPLPAAIPSGSYTCTTIVAGFYSSSSTGATIGTMRVTGPGAYTGLTKSGTGQPSRFAYESASGKVAWEGGLLKGFFGKVVDSHFGLDSRRVPYIAVTYRVREGGNLFDLSCLREGA